MGLDEIPSELLFLILQFCSSPRDLYHLIAASPACFRVFSLSPETIIVSVIKNGSSPETIRHLTALLAAPSGEAVGKPPLKTDVERFLNQYFDGARFDIPKTKDGVVKMCRLHNHLTDLVGHFASTTLRALGSLDQPACKSDPQTALSMLSTSERIRMERALLRYDLYCRVVPVDFQNRIYSLYSADQQHTLLLERLSGSEVEEMNCVLRYFISAIGGFVLEIEDRVVETILSAPGTILPTRTTGPFGQPIVNRHYDPEDKKPLFSFTFLQESYLGMFSEPARDVFEFYLIYIASLGMDFFHQLVHGDDATRNDLIRANSPSERAFLFDAWCLAPEIVPPRSHDADNDPSHANLGYSNFKRIDGDDGRDNIGYAHIPLQELGYVFWDSERIMSPSVKEKLLEARTADISTLRTKHQWSEKLAVEERLIGVQFRREVFRKIKNEFGSKFEHYSRYS